jgi:hypothetical protein
MSNHGKEANTDFEHSYDNPSDAILREHEAKVELDMMPCTGATNKGIPQRPVELIAPRYERIVAPFYSFFLHSLGLGMEPVNLIAFPIYPG